MTENLLGVSAETSTAASCQSKLGSKKYRHLTSRQSMSLEVSVLGMDGEVKFKIPAESDWTVKHLKEAISAEHGTPPIDQQLLYRDAKLRDAGAKLCDIFAGETAPCVSLVKIDGKSAAAMKIGGLWKKKKSESAACARTD
eukprot:TRINITY_DN80822_c0_g1_i1.p2 TRINITY_DN80822_c0_g1~~TRINITY_DN80822_c0_g1_i1.p2  ORF type:complete len:141 (-),score=29.77 TRINITY_DN80822_c0_g1_i1:248-670(-)